MNYKNYPSDNHKQLLYRHFNRACVNENFNIKKYDGSNKN